MQPGNLGDRRSAMMRVMPRWVEIPPLRASLVLLLAALLLSGCPFGDHQPPGATARNESGVLWRSSVVTLVVRCGSTGSSGTGQPLTLVGLNWQATVAV